MHKIEDFLSELASTLQVTRIYTDSHPKAKASLDILYQKLQDILYAEREIIIGIVGNEFVFGKEIFFDLSNRLKDLISELHNKGIEKIIFVRGVDRKELESFIKALVTRKEDTNEDFRDFFRSLELENVFIDKIKIGDSGKEKGVPEPVRVLSYDSTLEEASGYFKSILRNEVIDFYHMKVAMQNILKKLLDGHWEFLNLTAIKRHDLATFVHSLNVSILSMFLSSKLGFAREDTMEIGMAGLFHDIGKIAISRAVIQKPTVLDVEEMDKLKSHTLLGAEILLRYVESLGILPVLVSFEHHLRYDLRGYPKLRYTKKPCIASLMVSICDCYDALRGRRSYKRDYPPEMIYDIMLKEKGALFDPLLFDKFFQFIGVYPIGTIIELNEGLIAVVREENEDDIFSPRVEVISSGSKKGVVIDLKKMRDIKIKCSLNPLTRGKDYLSLI